MRIGLSGPTSTGKTTLMNILSKELDIDILQVTTREVFAKYGIKSQLETIIDAPQNPSKYYLMYQDLIKGRRDKFINNDNFITDRMPTDSLVYYMLQHLVHDPDDQETMRTFNNLCIEVNSLFDVIVLLPPVKQFCQSDDVRHINYSFNEMYYTIIKDWYSVHNSSTKILTLPTWKIDLTERVEFIKNFIRKEIT